MNKLYTLNKKPYGSGLYKVFVLDARQFAERRRYWIVFLNTFRYVN